MPNKHEILTIDQLSRVGELGGIERYGRVRFRTKKGTIWTIDIDDEDLTLEKARPIVDKRADELDALKG